MAIKRNVILFGAGAVIDWGAPKTYELTELVRNSGFYSSDGKTRITEFIYQTLIRESGYLKEEVNFETIINVIEELLVYYAKHGLRKKVPSLIKAFFNPAFEQELMNFSIIGGEAKQFYKLHIPGKSDEWAIMNHGQEGPEQFFLQQLLAEILTDISMRIEKYAFHTEGKSNVINEQNTGLNTLFQRWALKHSQNSILRMYTLNYDRNFKILLAQTDPPIEVFEGFDCDEIIEYTTKLRPNVKRILQDQEAHVHYNLHGSVFWRVQALNHNQLPLPEFYLSGYTYLEVNTDEFPTFQSERGKTVFLTNIVTGYQKTQRAVFSPFKQMQAALDRDCLFANQLIIVGYSFGDEHINSSIRTALQENENLQVEIIDPSFTTGEVDLNIMLNIFAASKYMANRPVSQSKNLHSFLGGRVTVHTKTFMQYLTDILKPENCYTH